MNDKRLYEIILEIKAICMANNVEIYKLSSILDTNKTTINFNQTYGKTLGTVNQIYLTQQKEMLEKENKNLNKIVSLLEKELEREEKIMDKHICDYCMGAKPIAIGKGCDVNNNDYGIAIHYPRLLVAYGYDVHGHSSNGVMSNINYCPMCGRDLRNL